MSFFLTLASLHLVIVTFLVSTTPPCATASRFSNKPLGLYWMCLTNLSGTAGLTPGNPKPHPRDHQQHQHYNRYKRPERVRLHLPIEMQYAETRRYVDKAMELPPPFPQTADPSLRRGYCEREKEQPCCEPYHDVSPLDDVLQNELEVQGLVQYGVRKQMDSQVEERK